MTRIGVTVGLLALVAMPAMADAPPLQPSRDVTVTYRVLGEVAHPANAPAVSAIRISFAAAGERLRVEPVGQPTYMLIDRSAGRMMMVLPAQRRFMDLPYDPSNDPQIAARDARFTRRGHATVAGIDCTEYDVRSNRGEGTACLTDDGVMLRAKGVTAERQGGGLEATEVAYGARPAAAFAPPPGFQRMEMPQLGQPLATGRPRP